MCMVPLVVRQHAKVMNADLKALVFSYLLTERFHADFVNNNPSAFEDAYFDFEWLNIYT